ncbi:MAG: hypothetical protein SVK08_04275 [Halobacteriota archaeon]|nr:hypothetical protein [Halobacteriota archaeon]
MKIDKYNLDEEWISFDNESETTGENYANAIHARDTFKNEVFDPYVAELDLEIRNNPDRFGLSKLSEKGVQSVIDKDETFMRHKLHLIDLDRDVNIANAKNIHLSRRGKALENLTKLVLRDYYFGDASILGDQYKEKMQDAKTQLAMKNDLNTPEAKAKMKSKLKLKKKGK